MSSGIYQIFNLKNGKRYIGQSKDIKARFSQHKSDLKYGRHCNQHLQASYNKYGKENFAFNILEYAEEDSITEREQFWMDALNALDRNYGYNICTEAQKPNAPTGLDNPVSIPITFKGKTQNMTDWAKEIGIGISTLCDRLKKMSVEEALTTEKNSHYNNITFNGKTMCIAEWADETGINRRTLGDRLGKLGWSVEKALTTKGKALADVSGSKNPRARQITFNGKTQCVSEWADEIGIKRCTLGDRLGKLGWSVEKALTTPMRGQKC